MYPTDLNTDSYLPNLFIESPQCLASPFEEAKIKYNLIQHIYGKNNHAMCYK